MFPICNRHVAAAMTPKTVPSAATALRPQTPDLVSLDTKSTTFVRVDGADSPFVSGQ